MRHFWNISVRCCACHQMLLLDNMHWYAVGEVDFWIFNFLHFAIDGKNNSKTKVEKVFFFIFMSSYAEMSFLN
jgi:hypothetical protein